MEITIEKLLEGKPTIIKDKEYLSTLEYVLPFINLMKKFTKEFYCDVQLPSQFTITNNKNDITYNRVWIQAIMPHNISDNIVETYNLVYGLDVRQPVYKIFKAYKDKKSENLFCFDSRWLNVYELRPNEQFINFDNTIHNLMSMVDDSEIRFRKMNSEFLSSSFDDRHKKLGDLIEKSMFYEYYGKGGKTKLSPDIVIKAFQDVYMNSSSKYFVKDVEECSVFNYYNALSSRVTNEDKDILCKFEKNYLILQILNDELCK